MAEVWKSVNEENRIGYNESIYESIDVVIILLRTLAARRIES